MEEQIKDLQTQVSSQSQHAHHLEAQLAQMMELMKGIQATLGEKERSPSTARQNHHDQPPRPLGYTPKLEFPVFDGSNSTMWIKKCARYFSLCRILDEQKVDLASLNMIGKAETWVTSYLAVHKNVSWDEFVVDLIARFRDEGSYNVIEKFNKLQQLGSIDSYIDDFEALKGLMMQRTLCLTAEYFLDCFIGGLKPSLKPFVKAFRPATMAEAIEYARLQEENLAVTVKPSPSYSKPPYIPSAVPKPTVTSVGSKFNPRTYIPASVRAEKMAKGECYYCNKPYDKNHNCQFKKTQLFTVEILGDEELEDEMVDMPVGEGEQDTEQPVIEPCISMNALSGSQSFQTMRVVGTYGKKPLHILVDSGSTHNFMDIKLAQRLGCPLEKIPPQAVAVADGNHLACQYMCKNFSWDLHNQKFTTDVMLIPLGSCDMVLGVQWLSTLGPVQWDFKKLVMDFHWQGVPVKLQGVPANKVKVHQGDISQKLVEGASHLCFLQLVNPLPGSELELPSSPNLEFHSVSVTTDTDAAIHPALQNILDKYASIFEEPHSLPPTRGTFDHRIPLDSSAGPINIRPYRYPLKQRDVIEKLVGEMLDNGIIQNSCSPFASPVVLVGKKDGTWRLCIDYRELNKKTIKDKFPIPVIDELIDELSGSVIFSKLDLRAGYHQLRMNKEDVYKTAFKTHEGHHEFLVMPFGLTNAPASFQGWMNSVFKQLLRKCVLVFFDDILVYSSSEAEHWVHLEEVFKLMQQHNMSAKASKCSFAMKKVEYLGHFISGKGVETDPKKVEVVSKWPIPKSVKELRSFLGMAGYYRKFVRNYAVLSRPLTNLLKKGAFIWDEEANKALEDLKRALTSAPVLSLPNFSKQFVVETDASNEGIGAVLMQEDHPLAYISRALGPKWQRLSVYEKELLAIVFAVQKWEQYLSGSHFIIKTDQRSLKWLLQQKISTPFQQFWLSKLMGFDYEIQYRSGKENLVADALSRVQGSEILLLSISLVSSDLKQLILQSYTSDIHLTSVIQKLQNQQLVTHYSLQDEFLKRKGKIVIGNVTQLRTQLLHWFHSTGEAGHSGRDLTSKRIKSLFYWKGLTKDVARFVRQCTVCQAAKADCAAYPGLLQPLPIPEEVWVDVSMDFITGLPKSKGKDVIFVVVDRLSKSAHFVSLAHPFSAIEVAQAYLDNIFKLHGWPRSIVSDRDPIFLSQFWQGLFSLHGTEFNLSSAYHPQTDGQTEVVNRCLEAYLRCMCGDKPKEWSLWLPLAEWWFNTHFCTSTGHTPYEVVYNQPPPLHLPYLPGEASNGVVDRSMQRREQMIYSIKSHLLKAQTRMKQQADGHRSEREFEVGDWVWLKLQPYRQITVQQRANQKLSNKYSGPFQIGARVGQVAYKLKLPANAQIHDVIHVSQLKKFRGALPIAIHIPDWLQGRQEDQVLQPKAILERRTIKFQNGAQIQYLIQWEGFAEFEATWEPAVEFEAKYPSFIIPGVNG